MLKAEILFKIGITLTLVRLGVADSNSPQFFPQFKN